MATDATTLLIQRILHQLSPDGASAQQSGLSLIGQGNSVLSTAANWAQILGTAEGPVVLAGTVAATQTAGSAAASAAAEAGALDSTVATAGIAGIAILMVSFLLANLAGDDGSTETQALDQLGNEILDIEEVTLANYWQDKLTSILSFWNSPTGGLGTDLDNLANEGTGGTDVKNDVTKFHDNALAFVNNLIPSKTPGTEPYWERPFLPDQAFSAQAVAYAAPPDPETPGAPIAPGATMGWYGTLPQPQAGPPLGGSSGQMALDPWTALPFLLLGLESYMTLESLVHLIDTSQPTFTQFLKSFQSDLRDYTSFLFSQYQLAVNGIVKSDIPSAADVFSFIYLYAEVENIGDLFPDNTFADWGGSIYYPGVPGNYIGCPYAGFAWNGVLGAVTAYPQYGAYESSPPMPVPWSSTAGLIDLINTNNIVNELLEQIGGKGSVPPLAASLTYNQNFTLSQWSAPWAMNKAILGTMARWKAIYLINGFDQVWSILQSLRALAQQSQLPTMLLNQDGTIANGNWSIRELCSVLNVSGIILAGVPTPYGDLTTLWVSRTVDGTIAGWTASGYSLYALVGALYNIGGGNWAAPPSSPESGPRRPLSFRGLMAAAAV